MSRWSRVGRGASAAFFATLVAACSHTIAGADAPDLFAVLVTALFALPLCVALAGRRLSLPRLSAAVLLSQALFHWCFSLLGLSTVAAGGEPLPAHAHHALVPIGGFVPDAALAAAADPGLLMWLWHGVAAVATIALLRFGERAAHSIANFVWDALRALWRLRPGPAARPLARPLPQPRFSGPAALAARACAATATRGPPARLA